MQRALFVTSTLFALAAPAVASAFCGFYVAGADTSLYNNATMVVMMRDGTRTVLAMQNDYQGPPENFALVIPVPEVLSEDNVKTLDNELFDHIDRLAAPRLVEYWEQDPCEQARMRERAMEEDMAAEATGMPAPASAAADLGVTIEAEFTVAEYDIVILSARDSTGLDTWLRQNDYRIPEGAEAVLRPYVAAGTKFFVAKVDVSKVRFVDGHAMLSPLRFHYDTPDFNLPVRLGLLNSNGTQDLIVHILAPDQRYEVANYPNTTIPTNIRVSGETRERFGEFYAALFDKTLEEHPRAVVTEYAWQATNCDPCPSPVLSQSELMTLGADVLPSFAGGGHRATVTMGTARIQGDADATIVNAVLTPRVEPLRNCVQARLGAGDSVSGTAVQLRVTIGTDGLPSGNPTVVGSAPEGVRECIVDEARHLRLPPPANGQPIVLQVPFVLGSEQEDPWAAQQRMMSFVLTRLHARYTQETLSEDLVFRPAAKIIGGRGVPDDTGAMPQGVQENAYANNFQGRYAILHPWEGPLTCSDPVRGVWGGPPSGVGASNEVRPATDLAFAPRGQISLADVVRQNIPEIHLTATTLPGPIGVAAAAATGAASDVPPSDGDGGCGSCGVAGEGAPIAAFALLAVVGLALGVRRRR